MSDCGNSSIFDNSKYKELLSDEKFIEFLINKLKNVGFNSNVPIELLEGNKIDIEDLSQDGELYKFVISYLDVIEPTSSASCLPSSFEKGVVINEDEIDIDFSYTRKTYPLKSVTFLGANGVINKVTADLTNLDQDDSETQSGTNANQVLGLQTEVASVTVFDDKNNQSVSVARITRQDRWYWGVSEESDLNTLDVLNDYSATGLGNIPNNIDANVGNGKYVWIATVPSKDIKDTTLKITQVESSVIRQLTPVAGYNVNYNIKRTGLKSGGTIKFLID